MSFETLPLHQYVVETEHRSPLPEDFFALQPGEVVPFVYNDVSLDLKVMSLSSPPQSVGKTPVFFREYIVENQGEEVLTSDIRVEFADQQSKDVTTASVVPIVLSGIVRAPKTDVHTQNEQLKGLGREVFRRTFLEIQEMSNQSQRVLCHEVRHRVSMGLLPDRWDKLFVPMLVKQGYQRKKRGVWKKVYHPVSSPST